MDICFCVWRVTGFTPPSSLLVMVARSRFAPRLRVRNNTTPSLGCRLNLCQYRPKMRAWGRHNKSYHQDAGQSLAASPMTLKVFYGRQANCGTCPHYASHDSLGFSKFFFVTISFEIGFWTQKTSFETFFSTFIRGDPCRNMLWDP
jgi:hypothetical protein